MEREDLVLVSKVAPDLGLTPDGLALALRRQGLRVFKKGGRNAVSIGTLERHVKQRERYAPVAAKRPKGWWKTAVAAEALGMSVSKLRLLQAEGKVEAVRCGKDFFYNPESVRRAKQERELVPPSWVPLPEVARVMKLKNGRDLTVRARDFGFEVRRYAVKTEGSMGTGVQVCIRRDDVAELVEKAGRPDTFPGRLTTAQMAEAAGVKVATVMMWRREGLPCCQGRYHRCWFDPQETVQWLRQTGRKTSQAHADALAAFLTGERAA